MGDEGLKHLNDTQDLFSLFLFFFLIFSVLLRGVGGFELIFTGTPFILGFFVWMEFWKGDHLECES